MGWLCELIAAYFSEKMIMHPNRIEYDRLYNGINNIVEIPKSLWDISSFGVENELFQVEALWYFQSL
jgi:hypothetical protein